MTPLDLMRNSEPVHRQYMGKYCLYTWIGLLSNNVVCICVMGSQSECQNAAFLYYWSNTLVTTCVYTCDYWCTLVTTGVRLWLLVYACDYWCTLMTTGVRLWLLVYTCDFWCTLVTTGIHLWLLVYACDYWCTLMTTGVHLWLLVLRHIQSTIQSTSKIQSTRLNHTWTHYYMYCNLANIQLKEI